MQINFFNNDKCIYIKILHFSTCHNTPYYPPINHYLITPFRQGVNDIFIQTKKYITNLFIYFFLTTQFICEFKY